MNYCKYKSTIKKIDYVESFEQKVDQLKHIIPWKTRVIISLAVVFVIGLIAMAVESRTATSFSMAPILLFVSLGGGSIIACTEFIHTVLSFLCYVVKLFLGKKLVTEFVEELGEDGVDV